ncbi:MAG TPA: citramalate synthase [Candidatus Omnitrophota bacterium]|nr:citramalate synthase [Candidatus Omnitrophota bacterium]
MPSILIYDTTLRDGSQSEGVSFSVNDKVRIAEKLDELGVHYIEGGWPGSNPKDKEFFKIMQTKKMKNSVVTAFGSTRRANIQASDDNNLKELVDSGAAVITIFGKSSDLHVKDVLKTTLEENLAMIESSITFLKESGKKVFYDAEHFFDAYKRNAEYALQTLITAQNAKADFIILCDTNGGALPLEVANILKDVRLHIKIPLGIHCHNDLDLAVANSLAAVEAGCTQVQGTFNGLGERCGNADLTTIIGILHTKTHFKAIPESKLKNLTEAAYFISEISNVKLPDNHALVGHSAFAHKAGVHIDAMLKNPLAYEHLDPKVIGNHRRFLTSELAGKMPIIMKAQKLDIKIDKKSEEAKKLLELLQEKELQGYQFEAADASFEILLKRQLKKYKPFFDLKSFKVTTEKRNDGKMFAEASVRLKINGQEEYGASDGDGPVDALDRALRKVLTKFYPNLQHMRLTDYKVRVIDSKAATAAKVRVLIESQDDTDAWTTVGVHENIIEASWEALIDSVEYKLLKDTKK